MNMITGGNTRNCLAIDCGNSSIRIVLGRFDGTRIDSILVEQTPHREILVGDVWYWDILFIFECVKRGIAKAGELCGRIDSAGISTWGIDHGLLGDGGILLANPLCYRNAFGEDGLSGFSPEERRLLFERTGVQCDKINTVFQMLGYRKRFPGYWAAAKTALLIPDLLNFLLTGEKNSDRSIASTTQLYDVRADRYADAVFDMVGVDRALFPDAVPHGAERGTLRRDLARELGVRPFPVVSVPSHDTAAAVAAVPAADSGGVPLFISSGTWSLVGTELPAPLIDDRVFRAGLANEAGVLGTVTLLRNSAGLFIVQRLKRECGRAGWSRTWEEITLEVERAGSRSGRIDPNAPEFFNPPDMREAVAEYLEARGGARPDTEAEYFRVAYESLAESYRGTIAEIEAITGRRHPVVHVIGGGAQNALLNRMTAEATGKTVVAGPYEATSLGTAAAQLLHGGQAAGLSDIRRIAAASCETETFHP